jgi:hypothetical protein
MELWARRLMYAAIFLAFWSMTSTAMDTPTSRDRFLGPDGQLTARVELKDAQGGFAGFSGTLWTIEPDGTFRVSQFLNEKVHGPDRTGQLTQESLTRLAEVLVVQDFLGLPMELGHQLRVNPHRLTLSFDQKTVSLGLPPGVSIAEAAAAHKGDEKNAEARFLALAGTVRQLVEDAAPPPR